MDRNQFEGKIEDFDIKSGKLLDIQSENENSSQVISKSHLTPGKFTEGTIINNYEDSNFNNNAPMNNFYLYKTNIDTNSIWKTRQDIHRSFSLPNANENENSDVISNIWNCKKSTDLDDNNKGNSLSSGLIMPPITVAVPYDTGVNLRNMNDADSGDKIEVSGEENNRILSIVNSHEGWGVKPVNQKTPWENPEIICTETDGYPDTFSSWLNDTPNGASAWETYEKSKQSSLNSATVSTQSKGWAAVSQDCNWSQIMPLNNGSSCLSKSLCNGYKSPDPVLPNFSTSTRSVGNVRLPDDQIKKKLWIPDSKSMEFQNLNGVSNPSDSYVNQRNRRIDVELQRYKLYKDAHLQITQEHNLENQKIIDIERKISTLSSMSLTSVQDVNSIPSRNMINELIRQYETTKRNMQLLRVQLETVRSKMAPIEDELMRENVNISSGIIMSPSTTVSGTISSPSVAVCGGGNLDMITNKMNFMRVNSNGQDLRLDVPEFVPGKRWNGLNNNFSQNGKENRVPNCITGNSSAHSGYSLPMSESNSNNTNDVENIGLNNSVGNSSFCWLLIQHLPSHVNVDMVQSFFSQNNTPYVSPLHCNPFSRWMLIKFHNPSNCQKAYQLLAGKIGAVTLVSDHAANMRLQELKGVMANFVAHQN